MRMAIAPGIHIVTMGSCFARTRAARLADLLCCLVTFWLLCSISALAHDHHAPPARIITDEQVGPWTISVWAQQHMDTGRFFVKVRPSSGAAVPTVTDDLKVEIGVQPANQNSPETFYAASRESPDEPFAAEAPFDAEKSWQIRVRLQSSRGVNRDHNLYRRLSSRRWTMAIAALFIAFPFRRRTLVPSLSAPARS